MSGDSPSTSAQNEGPKQIWLDPKCVTEERCWRETFEHNCECETAKHLPTEYRRADLVSAPSVDAQNEGLAERLLTPEIIEAYARANCRHSAQANESTRFNSKGNRRYETEEAYVEDHWQHWAQPHFLIGLRTVAHMLSTPRASVDALQEALTAIQARINGHFDHPIVAALPATGNLRTDISAIARAALRTEAASERETEGFVLVPEEPDDEMVQAVFNLPTGPSSANNDTAAVIRDWYKAMLAAAPSPSAQAGKETR